MASTTHTSPLARLTLITGTAGLRHVYVPGRAPSLTPRDHEPSALGEVVGQLEQFARRAPGPRTRA
jgi:hypothetical protein